MLVIQTDRRRMEAEPDVQAHERAAVLARGFVEHQVGLARALRRIQETRTFVAFDCASIEEYGARLGLCARDVRQLVDMGHCLDAATPMNVAAPDVAAPNAPPAGAAEPRATVEEAVLAGRLSVESASLAGRLLAKPELLREGEDAVAIVTAQPVRRVQALIREREEEAAQEQPVVPLCLAVTPAAKEAFGRARVVASERADAMLTEGETFAAVVNHYLDSFDPLREAEGTRRSPDTAGLPGVRYVPAEVRRAVRARSGERCEVPDCPHRAFLEFAHIDPHRADGSREADNLLRLCHGHHVLLDAGRIRFAGWQAPEDGGRPRFRDRHGRALEETTPPAASATERALERVGAIGPGEREPRRSAGRPPPEAVG